MLKHYKIGQVVYYHEVWSDSICSGIIESIETINNTIAIGLEDVGVVDKNCNIVCPTPGHTCREPKDLYPTVAAAYNDIERKNNLRVQQWCKEIKTVEDLVRFPLQHSLNGEEYTDHNARKAYQIRAKELLNITFDHETNIP